MGEWLCTIPTAPAPFWLDVALRHACPPRRLPAEALRPVALQLEARGWLFTPTQRCPLVRAAFLQVLALLPASLSPGFAQSIREAISAELGGLTLGKEQQCAELQVLLPTGDVTAAPFCEARAWEWGPILLSPCPQTRTPLEAERWKWILVSLQVGSAVLHQTMARFACSEAARLANSERIGAVCSLLRQPNPDVQLAILSWVIEGEGEECKELEKALQLTLLVR